MSKNNNHPRPESVLLHNLNHLFNFIETLYTDFPQANHDLSSFYNTSNSIMELKRKSDFCKSLLIDEITDHDLSYIFQHE